MQEVTEAQEMPDSEAPPLRVGVGTTDHECPFQASLSGPPPLAPTARQLLAEGQARPLRLSPVPGLGAGTTDQVLPFQDSARMEPLPRLPRAWQEPAAAQDTASSEPPVTFGLETVVHAVPFQDSMRPLSGPP